LTVNGMFLMVVGAVQVALELSGYFGVGPYAAAFHSSPYTICFVEAHGLAVIIGWTLFSQRTKAYRPANHILAASVHTLLAAANIFFWRSYPAFGMVLPGILSTVAHIGLVILQVVVLSRQSAGSRGTS
jgi:uncharacterized membrane protein YGL010W